MSLELCVLGSGSAGNSTVVRSPWGLFLLDVGFGPRVTAQRLHAIGLDLNDIAAIVLTHLDHDHFNPHWLRTLIKHRIKIHCPADRVHDLLQSPEARDLINRFPNAATLPSLIAGFDAPFEPLPRVHLEPFRLAHDITGSHGFLISCDGYRVGFATDLGHVPDSLIDRFCGVDLLALESNYDPDMQLASDRPWHLKNRIMGGQGHLSNQQALAAVQAILDRTAATHGPDCLPRHLVLLHRSRQCNCPKLIRRLFTGDPRIARILTLADQFEPTPWLTPRRPRAQIATQLEWFWKSTANV